MTRLRSETTRLASAGLAVAVLALNAPDARGEGSELPDAGDAQIKALPFNDTGDTSDNVDNRNVTGVFDCPFMQGGGKDVFYSIVSLTDIEVTISLCGSDFDTRLYVLDATLIPIACNDDECRDTEGHPTLRSELDCVALAAGEQYFIGVDGFDANESGPYVISVTQCEPVPPFMCPKGSSDEGETCVVGQPDTFNVGCSDPKTTPVFSPIACGETICGTSWADTVGGGLRDVDWYQIETDEPATLTLEGQFSYDGGILGFVQMNFGSEGSGMCDEILGLTPSDTGAAGEMLSITTPLLQPGIHWFFVAPDLSADITCDKANEYWIRLLCQPERDCPLCDGDVNGDNLVGFADILFILANWGPCP